MLHIEEEGPGAYLYHTSDGQLTSSWHALLQAAGDQGSLVDAVLALLGLEASAVADTDTMESLGMDSMQVAEVRARLQRALGRTVPLEEVLLGRRMTGICHAPNYIICTSSLPSSTDNKQHIKHPSSALSHLVVNLQASQHEGAVICHMPYTRRSPCTLYVSMLRCTRSYGLVFVNFLLYHFYMSLPSSRWAA